MIKSKSLLIAGLAVLSGSVFISAWLAAVRADVAEDTTSGYWIGAQVTPVPKLFLSHFGVNNESGSRIAVESVVPDSPASKAGIERGDVILQFGEKEIFTLPELVEHVSKVKEAATKLEVIRGGTKTTLIVTPSPRPDPPRTFSGIRDLREVPHMPQFGHRLTMDVFPERDPLLMMRQMEEFFRQMQGGDDGGGLMLAPNIQQGFGSTGKQISVAKQTDQTGKTSIKVTRVFNNGDNTEKAVWEVESTDELPEEIRADVRMLLGE